ncbi:MAG: CapA family protein, partial [Clostridiales bacterium]|nr:CapA family protein [Clostridiales bacterium]
MSRRKAVRQGLSLLLSFALALSLAACGQTAAEESSLSAEESAPAVSSADSSAEIVPETDPADASAAGDSSAQPVEEISTEPEPESLEPDPDTAYEYTLCFAGDVNLAEGQYTTAALDSYGLSGCVSETLRGYMTGADIMCLNNEFTYSSRGTPLEGKTYTYRASPSRVSVLEELGVDVAVLANNHIYDYGEEALLDTLDTLDSAGIARIGAGKNLADASAIY